MPRGLLLATLLLVTSLDAHGTEFSLSPGDDCAQLARRVQAGDSVILRDGIWRDVSLCFAKLPGISDRPIEIRAETPGGVVISGRSEFCVSGQHVVISGIIFRNLYGYDDAVHFRTDSSTLAHHCRITDCLFDQTVTLDSTENTHWLSIFGGHHRIDHCRFEGKTTGGTTMVVWLSNAASDASIGHHQINHNHFGPRPELGRNGGETIRIGTSKTSEQRCAATVESNYFHACDGESEIISNKSCDNIYRHNRFDRCAGALTLRHGHRCVVDGNAFLGGKKRKTGGVRIIGRSHQVVNNYMEGLRGDAERAAICLMNGIRDSPLNGYAPVNDAKVAGNTLIDCKVSLEIGLHDQTDQVVAPSECVIHHNLLINGKWPALRLHSSSEGIQFFDNAVSSIHPSDTILNATRCEFGWRRDDDGLFRPSIQEAIRVESAPELRSDFDGQRRSLESIVGCDDPKTSRRSLISPEETGPRWQ